MGAGASSDHRTISPATRAAIPREAEPDLPREDDAARPGLRAAMGSSAFPRVHSDRWTCTSSDRQPPLMSAPRSTRRSTRRSGPPGAAGTAAPATSRPRATSPTAVMTRGRDGTCCSRRSRRQQRATAGSVAARSTTSRSGWPCPRPRRTASRRSTRCSRRRPARRSSRTSATTWRAGCSVRSGSAMSWGHGSAHQGRRRATRTRRGSGARALASANARPRCSSRPPGRRPSPTSAATSAARTTSRACSRRFASHRR